MNEISVNAVSKTDPSAGAVKAYEMRGLPVTERPAAEPGQGVQNVTAAQTSGVQQPRQTTPEKPAQTPPKSMTNGSDCFLKFRVDEKTRDVTVYVIDRATKRVLRSIPPEELNTLQAGDLLELLA
jgi:hypothetical protein